MDNHASPSRLSTIAAIGIVVAGLYFAQDVLIPLALATLLSFLLAPLVARLERWGLHRVPAVIGVVVLGMLVIVFLGWIVAGQVASIAADLPRYSDNLHSKLDLLRGRFGGMLTQATQTAHDIGEDLAQVAAPAVQAEEPPLRVRVDQPSLTPLETIRSTIGPLFSALAVAGIVVVFVIFMLLQREDLRDRFIRLVGGGEIPVTTHALDEASSKVSRYLLTMTFINGLHGTCVATGLALLGFPNFLLWGLLSMLLRFVPYFGPWIAAGFPVFLSLASDEGWTKPLETIGLFVVLELVSNNWIEPWLYGSRTGISPVAVLVSAVFWAWLWGGVGLVLATPLTVCLVVLGKYVPHLGFLAILLGDEPVMPPEVRLYQRLLAADTQEAWRVFEAALEEHSLVEAYDSVVLPALALAEQDHRRGQVEPATQTFLLEGLRDLVDEAGERANRPLSPGDASIASVAAAGAAAAPNGRELRVLCVPARGASDEIAARMLAQVVAQSGVDARPIAIDALAGELIEEIARNGADVVCLSAVPPTALAHVRYLYKRLSTRFPELPIVVGVWSPQVDRADIAARLGAHPNTTIAVSLAQARAAVAEALTPARQRLAAEVAPEPDRRPA
jgi:predicted PurR-regulated permease PerM